MGHYENGGSNAIGVATTSSFAAVWTADTPYIQIIRSDFFRDHEAKIREAAVRGARYSDVAGQTGVVAVLSTSGDVDDDGWPKGYTDLSDYVAAELEDWTRRDAGAYEKAIAEGYTR